MSKNLFRKLVCSVTTASIAFAPLPAIAQNPNEDSFTKRLLCMVGFLSCDEVIQQQLSAEELQEQIDRITIREEDFGAAMQGIGLDLESLQSGGNQDLVDQTRPELERAIEGVQRTVIRSLPEETKNIVESCSSVASAINSAATVDTSTTPEDKAASLPDASGCTDALMQREREVAKDLHDADQDIAQLDSEIRETERKLRETDDPVEKRRLAEEKKRKEDERAQKKEERERLERERKKLQETRMMIGLALVIAGLAAGGLPGLLLINQGLSMMAPPGGGPGDGKDGGGRDNHPSSGDVAAESDASERSDQGTASGGEQSPQPQEIPPVADGDTTPDPAHVRDMAFGVIPGAVVPVAPNKYSNGGYFLEHDVESGRYTLRYINDPSFERIIEQGKVQPFLSSITVPTPLVINEFVSLGIDRDKNVHLEVRIDGNPANLYISQNPAGKTGWFLADVRIGRN